MPRLPENAFPDRVCAVHELGHLLMAARYADQTVGIHFYVHRPSLRAATDYVVRPATSIRRRLAIAVAGAVANELAGAGASFGLPSPEQSFLEGGADHCREFAGDRSTVDRCTVHLSAPARRRAVAAALALARRNLTALGGAPLLLELSGHVLDWLEADKRARWREAVDWPWVGTSVLFRTGDLVRALRNAKRGGTDTGHVRRLLEAHGAARRPRTLARA